MVRARQHWKPNPTPDRAPIPAPKGLRGARFQIDGEAYAVLVFPLPTSAPLSPAGLTDAEAAVAALVARGFSNEEIGATRNSSPRTVANQLQAIYRKLGIGSRVDLVRVISHAPLNASSSARSSKSGA